MKPSTRDILFIFVGLFISMGTLWASRAGAELRLRRDVAWLNSVGRSSQGERTLSRSLEIKFRPGPGQIAALRRQKLGYGDISVVLALASRLSGGVSRINIEKVVKLWGATRLGGWGRVARILGVKVERVVLQVESLNSRPARKALGASASRSRGYDPVAGLVHGG